MDWKELSLTTKFTPLEKVFEKYGKPKFKLGDRPVYYMGNGFLLSYCERKFKVEGLNRVEYGDLGEYILSASFFRHKQELILSYHIEENEEYPFDSDTFGSEFEIVEGVKVGFTFEDVTKILRPISSLVYYREGETKSMKNGVFKFRNQFIEYGNYTFIFFGKFKKTKLSAFDFTFHK